MKATGNVKHHKPIATKKVMKKIRPKAKRNIVHHAAGARAK